MAMKSAMMSAIHEQTRQTNKLCAEAIKENFAGEKSQNQGEYVK
jgi:hypothetical protein